MGPEYGGNWKKMHGAVDAQLGNVSFVFQYLCITASKIQACIFNKFRDIKFSFPRRVCGEQGSKGGPEFLLEWVGVVK